MTNAMHIIHFLAFLICFVIVLNVSLSPSAQAKNQKYVEWQLPYMEGQQYQLKARFLAKPNDLKQSLPVSMSLQVTANPGQSFTVCADSVTGGDSIAIIPLSRDDYLDDSKEYQLITSSPQTRIELYKPTYCKPDNTTNFLYSFLDILHSSESFLAEWIREDRKENRRSRKSSTAGGSIGLPGWPTQPVSGEILLSGEGYNPDDGQDKLLPWIPFEISDGYSLTILPDLQLSEGFVDYLPDMGTYYALLDYLGYGEKHNVIVRFNEFSPFNIRISRTEQQELLKHITSARQLLSWLAPKLSGREQLVNHLIDIQTQLEENIVEPDENIQNAIVQQLARVLEQSDTKFSFELETYSLITMLADTSENDLKEFVSTSEPDNAVVYENTEEKAFIHQYGQGQANSRRKQVSSSNTNTSERKKGNKDTGQGSMENMEEYNPLQEWQGTNATNAAGATNDHPPPIVFRIFGGNSPKERMLVANGIIGFEYFTDSYETLYINPTAEFVIQVINDESVNNRRDYNGNVVLIDLEDERYLNGSFSVIYKCFEKINSCVNDHIPCDTPCNVTCDKIREVLGDIRDAPCFTPFARFDNKKLGLRKEHIKSLWNRVCELYMVKFPNYLSSESSLWRYSPTLNWKYCNQDEGIKNDVNAQIKRSFRYQGDIDALLIRAGLKKTKVKGEVNSKSNLCRVQTNAVEPYGQLINLSRYTSLLNAFISMFDSGARTGVPLASERLRSHYISGMHDPVILTIDSMGGAWHALLLFYYYNHVSFFCLHITSGDKQPYFMNEKTAKEYLLQKNITGAISVKLLMRAYNVDYDIHKNKVEKLYRELAGKPWGTYEPKSHNCMSFCMQIFEVTNLDVSSYLTEIHSPQLIIESLSKEETHLSSLFCYNSWAINSERHKELIPECIRKTKGDDSHPGGLLMRGFAFIKGCGDLAANIFTRNCLFIVCGATVCAGIGYLYTYDLQNGE